MIEKIRERLAHNLPFFFGAPVLVWQIMFFFVPILLIIVLSMCTAAGWQGFSNLTLANFALFFKPTFARVILRSLLFALANALICLFIAYPIAYFLVFKVKRYQDLFIFWFILPFGTSFLLHVYAWFFVLERHGFINTLFMKLGVISQPLHILNTPVAVIIMMVYYYLPFMALPLYATLEKFDSRLLEASLDLGATWWQTVRKVMVPITVPGILSGFFLVFVPSFAEFAIPELMGGDRTMFAGTVISHYILGGTTISQGAAFTIVCSIILIIATAFFYWLIKRIVKRL